VSTDTVLVVTREPAGGTAAPPAPAAPEAVRHRLLRGHVPGEAGIWIFILGDMSLYGALFASFMADRSETVNVFNQSASTLHTSLGTLNTVFLLTSSLFVALGIRAARERIRPSFAPPLFAGAFACGFGFVVVKYFEYSDLLREGLYPTDNAFYTYYYVLTGIHLTHLLAGMCVLVFLYKVSKKARHEHKDIRAMESGASFWHVVDLLWIVLFPLLYLVS
jgi:nitric oxide reductase NorE protein